MLGASAILLGSLLALTAEALGEVELLPKMARYPKNPAELTKRKLIIVITTVRPPRRTRGRLSEFTRSESFSEMAIRRLALLLKIISAHQLTEFCNGVVRQIGLEAAVSHSNSLGSDPRASWCQCE